MLFAHIVVLRRLKQWYAPDRVKNQIEGNMLQSLSRALKEEVRFDERLITSADWGTYPILTFSDARRRECGLRCHRRTLAPDAVLHPFFSRS